MSSLSSACTLEASVFDLVDDVPAKHPKGCSRWGFFELLTTLQSRMSAAPASSCSATRWSFLSFAADYWASQSITPRVPGRLLR